MRTRRSLLLGSLAVSLPLPAFAQAAIDGSDFRVTLLGTGTPVPSITRFGPATLVQAGGETLLFDCGRGATQRLWQLGIRFSTVSSLFLTHLHSDHIVGIPDLWATGWLNQAWGGRREPFAVFGPPGTRDMIEHMRKAFAWDTQSRIKEQNLPMSGHEVSTTDFSEGVVFDRNGVKVIAFAVDHGPANVPAFGFRVEFDGRSVVLSGDTNPTDSLARAAKGADLYLQQVVTGARASDGARGIRTDPEQAARMFTNAAPRMAAYYHLGFFGAPAGGVTNEQALIDATRKAYSGPLVVGEDLMSFFIGRKEIAVKQN